MTYPNEDVRAAAAGAKKIERAEATLRRYGADSGHGVRARRTIDAEVAYYGADLLDEARRVLEENRRIDRERKEAKMPDAGPATFRTITPAQRRDIEAKIARLVQRIKALRAEPTPERADKLASSAASLRRVVAGIGAIDAVLTPEQLSVIEVAEEHVGGEA